MSYTWNKNKNKWSSYDFETIEECVKDAKYRGCKKGDIIYIGRAEHVSIKEMIDFQSLLVELHNEMYKKIGIPAYDWNVDYMDHNRGKFLEYENKLQELVIDYLKEIEMEPKFCKILEPKEFIIR